MKTWQELKSKSEEHDRLSKPEALAIIDILSESKDSLTISQIHDKFTKNYQNEITRRQISYCIDLMEENGILENGSISDKEKQYSLVDIKEKWRNQITNFQVIIMGIVVFVSIMNQNPFSWGLLAGVMLFIIIIEVEYTFFIWNKQKFLF